MTGIFPLGTTGESPTLDEDEMDGIVERTLHVTAGRVPVFVGVGGNATDKVVKTLGGSSAIAFDGIVSVCPYYNRPGQDGLREHFTRIAEATDRQILIYNIPYRTSVNMTHGHPPRLAELPNIVGVKDSCGNLAQSLDLLRHGARGFAVMTGEDPYALHHARSWRATAASSPRPIWPTERFVRRVRAHDRQRSRGSARGVGPARDARVRFSSRKPIRCPSSTVSGDWG